FSVTPRWPFCWWLVVLGDQYSRRILRLAAFRRMPNSDDVQDVLARTVREEGVHPRYVITDRGRQFRARGFRAWCAEQGIFRKRGVLGQVGSIAFVERLIRTVKDECTRRFLFPYSESAARAELAYFTRWYNGFRPHWRLQGATPDEVHDGAQPHWKHGRI